MTPLVKTTHVHERSPSKMSKHGLKYKFDTYKMCFFSVKEKIQLAMQGNIYPIAIFL